MCWFNAQQDDWMNWKSRKEVRTEDEAECTLAYLIKDSFVWWRSSRSKFRFRRSQWRSEFCWSTETLLKTRMWVLWCIKTSTDTTTSRPESVETVNSPRWPGRERDARNTGVKEAGVTKVPTSREKTRNDGSDSMNENANIREDNGGSDTAESNKAPFWQIVMVSMSVSLLTQTEMNLGEIWRRKTRHWASTAITSIWRTLWGFVTGSKGGRKRWADVVTGSITGEWRARE